MTQKLDTYYLGVWALEGDHADWIGVVTRDEPGGVLVLRHRLRPREAPNGDTHWHSELFPGKDEDEVVEAVDDMTAAMCDEPSRGSRQLWRRVVRGGLGAVIEELHGCPFLGASDVVSPDPRVAARVPMVASVNSHCARLDAFFDEELLVEQAGRFRDHLAACDRCQRVLHGRMQESVAASRGAREDDATGGETSEADETGETGGRSPCGR